MIVSNDLYVRSGSIVPIEPCSILASETIGKLPCDSQILMATCADDPYGKSDADRYPIMYFFVIKT